MAHRLLLLLLSLLFASSFLSSAHAFSRGDTRDTIIGSMDETQRLVYEELLGLSERVGKQYAQCLRRRSVRARREGGTTEAKKKKGVSSSCVDRLDWSRFSDPSKITQVKPPASWKFGAKANKLYFMHIEKTGGQTLHSILMHDMELGERLQCEYWDHTAKATNEKCKAISLNEKEFSDLRYVHGHLHPATQAFLDIFHGVSLDEMLADNSFITIIRDPLDRVRSHFCMLRKASAGGHDLKTFKFNHAHESLTNFAEVVSNYQTKYPVPRTAATYLSVTPELELKASSQQFDETRELSLERFKKFELVMVNERFEESVLLLMFKRLLYNPFVNISPIHIGRSECFSSDYSLFTEERAEIQRQRDSVDYEALEWANETLDGLIDDIGCDCFYYHAAQFLRRQPRRYHGKLEDVGGAADVF